MSNGTSESPVGLQWKWVVVGVIVGIVIVGAAYFTVAPSFKSEPIQMLVMFMGFILTGAIVGYFSPGVTMKEAAIAGGLVMGIMLIIVGLFGEDIALNMWRSILGLLLGVSLSWVGGWVGEKLQGSEGETEDESKRIFTDLQWKWVFIGVILGFALNVLFVFLITPIFNIDLNVALGAFLVSFVVTGFIVGFKSPGVTLKEPALAGFLAVVIGWIFLELGIDLSVGGGYLAFGLVLGFFLSLFGAWLGERYQLTLEAKGRESSG